MTGNMAGPPVVVTLPQEIDLTNSAATAASVLGVYASLGDAMSAQLHVGRQPPCPRWRAG